MNLESKQPILLTWNIKTCFEPNGGHCNMYWNPSCSVLNNWEDDARKRRRRLLRNVRKTHKETTSQKFGSAGDKTNQCYLYDNMLFVLPNHADSDMKTQSNLSSLEDEEVSDLKEVSQASFTSCVVSKIRSIASHVSTPTPVQVKVGNQSKSHAQTHTNSRHQNQGSSHHPRYPEELQAVNLSAGVIQAIKDLSQNQQNQDNVSNDEDLIFLKSLAPKMKLLNPTERMECQYEMHTLVMNYVRNSIAKSSSPQLPPDSVVSPQPGASSHDMKSQVLASGSPPDMNDLAK